MTNEGDSQLHKYIDVEYSRTVGRLLHESYAHSDDADPDWSFRDDGTLDVHRYDVEITEQGDIFGRYADVKEFLYDSENSAKFTGGRKNEVGSLEAHHLVPTQVLEQAGIDGNDGLAVAMDWKAHMSDMSDIHHAACPTGDFIFTDVDELKNYYVSEYNEMGVPEWGKEVEKFVEEEREQFEKGLADRVEHVEASTSDLPAAPTVPKDFKAPDEAIEEPNDSMEPIESTVVADRI